MRAQNEIILTQALPAAGEALRFDAPFPEHERLPRQAEFRFDDLSHGLIFSADDEVLGDLLTDRTLVEDFYRFHDAFHVSFCAVLGWSPVLRTFLDVRRRSDTMVNANEDGGRAKMIEESICHYIFVSLCDYGDDWEKGLNADLIYELRRQSRGLEVSTCDEQLWKRAIAVAWESFNYLSRNRGGRLKIDADLQSVSFIPLDSPAN